MSLILQVFICMKIICFCIIVLLSLMYLFLAGVVFRCHYRSDILTFNLCISFTFCSIYWLLFCIDWDYFNLQIFNSQPYNLSTYFKVMLSCQLAFAFVTIPINRYFSIRYPTKIFFKTNRWLVLCISSQWIVGFLVPLPLISSQYSVRQHFVLLDG